MSATISPTTTAAAAARRPLPGIDQLVVRSAVVLGALGALVAVQAAGATPAQWQQVSVLLFALLMAVRPDSVAGAVVTLWVVGLWATTPDPTAASALGCASGLVLLHVAALVAAQGPVRMAVDARQVARWALRGVGLWLAAAAMCGLGLLFTDARGGAWAHAAGLVVLVLAAGVVTLLVTPRRSAR